MKPVYLLRRGVESINGYVFSEDCSITIPPQIILFDGAPRWDGGNMKMENILGTVTVADTPEGVILVGIQPVNVGEWKVRWTLSSDPPTRKISSASICISVDENEKIIKEAELVSVFTVPSDAGVSWDDERSNRLASTWMRMYHEMRLDDAIMKAFYLAQQESKITRTDTEGNVHCVVSSSSIYDKLPIVMTKRPSRDRVRERLRKLERGGDMKSIQGKATLWWTAL